MTEAPVDRLGRQYINIEVALEFEHQGYLVKHFFLGSHHPLCTLQ